MASIKPPRRDIRRRVLTVAGIAALLVLPLAIDAAVVLPSYDPQPYRRVIPRRQRGVRSLWIRGRNALVDTRLGSYHITGLGKRTGSAITDVTPPTIQIGDQVWGKGPITGVRLTGAGKSEHDAELVTGSRSFYFLDAFGERIECEW